MSCTRSRTWGMSACHPRCASGRYLRLICPSLSVQDRSVSECAPDGGTMGCSGRSGQLCCARHTRTSRREARIAAPQEHHSRIALPSDVWHVFVGWSASSEDDADCGGDVEDGEEDTGKTHEQPPERRKPRWQPRDNSMYSVVITPCWDAPVDVETHPARLSRPVHRSSTGPNWPASAQADTGRTKERSAPGGCKIAYGNRTISGDTVPFNTVRRVLFGLLTIFVRQNFINSR